jgi:hypothetical protein
MDIEVFTDTVIARLKTSAPARHTLTEDDWKQERIFIGGLYRTGFSVDDAVKYELLTEEMNPDIDEEDALCKMELIQRIYSL